jgi:ABC-type thiamine transport system substrate-binding protein
MNVVYNVTSGVDQNTITYLLTNKQLIATSATSNTATFTGSWKVAPTGLPPTGPSNFTFFVNGNFVESTAVTNFEDLGGGTCLLTVNTAVLGYELESTDVILAIGKFN